MNFLGHDSEDHFTEHILDRQLRSAENTGHIVDTTGEVMLKRGIKQGSFRIANKVKHLLESGRTDEALEYISAVYDAGGLDSLDQ